MPNLAGFKMKIVDASQFERNRQFQSNWPGADHNHVGLIWCICHVNNALLVEIILLPPLLYRAGFILLPVMADQHTPQRCICDTHQSWPAVRTQHRRNAGGRQPVAVKSGVKLLTQQTQALWVGRMPGLNMRREEPGVHLLAIDCTICWMARLNVRALPNCSAHPSDLAKPISGLIFSAEASNPFRCEIRPPCTRWRISLTVKMVSLAASRRSIKCLIWSTLQPASPLWLQPLPANPAQPIRCGCRAR
jgi:hypothetical protein